MQQHQAAWRRSFSWLVLLIFSLLSCMPQAEINQMPAPGPATKSQALDLDFFAQPVTEAGFRTQEFVLNPDSPNIDKLKPRILNTYIGNQTGETHWKFEFAIPPDKTTTIQPLIYGTEPCQSTFNNWQIWTIEPPENASDPYVFTMGFGPSPVADAKDGAYTLTLRDEIGQEFTYTVYVNNGNPPVCPSPTPAPTAEPTPAPPGGGNGGNNGGGGNGGNGGGNGGGGKDCACNQSFFTRAFSILNQGKSCQQSCDVPKYAATEQPGGNYAERCFSTSNAPGAPKGLLSLAKVYDFDTGGPNLTFVFRFNAKQDIPTSTAWSTPVQVANYQDLGIQQRDLRIHANNTGDTMPDLEKLLYDTNYDNTNQPDGPNNFGDKGSFRLFGKGVTLASLNPGQYPKLNQVVNELRFSGKTILHNNMGYIFSAVNMAEIYNTTYHSNKKAILNIPHGSHQIKVETHFDKQQKRWMINCAK